MEKEENILEKSEKNRSIVPIVFIVILLLGIGGYFLYKYIKGNGETNVYYGVIDKLSQGSEKIINVINSDKTYTYDISFDIDGKDEDIKKLGTILNKLKLKMDFNMNTTKKTIDMVYDITYDNNSILNAGIYMNNNDLYIDAKEIFDKNIKVNLGDSLWDSINTKESKEIADEFLRIVKRNLKASYITITNDTINGVGVSKQTLDLNSKNLLEFENGILKDIENNNKIIDYLYKSASSNMVLDESYEYNSFKITKEMIKDSIKDIRNSLKEEKTNVLVETYLNNKNNKLEGLTLKINDTVVNLEKTGEDKFAIKVEIDKVTAEIGSISISENMIDLDIDFMDMIAKFKIEFNKNNIFGLEYKFVFEDINMEANIRNNTTNGTGEIKLVQGKNNFKINFNFEETKNAIKKDLNNYIDVDKLTEEDLVSIMMKFEENKNLATFIQDVTSVFKFPVTEMGQM